MHTERIAMTGQPVKVLDGVRVLELGNFITAPYAAMLLAELGADVVKVERPEGDPFRNFAGEGPSPVFTAFNRNKRSIVLDMTKPGAAEVMKALVANADVMLMNMRSTALDKLGIGYDALHAVNPRLVYCSITGFGADGPYASRPAYDTVGQAMSGLMSRVHGEDDPRIPGPNHSDSVTGIFACIGILGALNERHRTGVGRKVEVSMLEATMALSVDALAHLFALGEEPAYYNRASQSQSYLVKCRDGKRIALHLSSPDKFWKALGQVIERPDLLERYAGRVERIRNYEALGRELNAIFGQRDRDEWLARLGKHDIPFAPERTIGELEHDPQVKHLDVFNETQSARFGKVRGVNRPVRYDGDNRSGFLPPPGLGEHTDEVLTSVGISRARIDELRRAGAI
jgi:crotonobetainyl-CoA:carnitine CoA-transferase CaiB-like acyl-CoA transferase